MVMRFKEIPDGAVLGFFFAADPKGCRRKRSVKAVRKPAGRSDISSKVAA